MTDNKILKLEKISNPIIVYNKALKLLQNKYFEINISTRKDKKYMIKGEFSNDKWVHFGSINYEDYTHHKNLKRRELFLKRNAKWLEYPKYSPAYFSYYLLW